MKKGWENQSNLPKLEEEFKAGDNKKYEVELIVNSMVDVKKVESQILGFY